MELPDWVDYPLSEYGLDPLHDAVGKLIARVYVMELFLWLAAEHLDEELDLGEGERRGGTWCAARIATLADRVPETERGELVEEMRVAGKILELRHAVVHSFWDSTLDGQPLPVINTARRHRKTGELIPATFDRTLLIAAADRAYRIWAYLQSHSLHWPEGSAQDE